MTGRDSRIVCTGCGQPKPPAAYYMAGGLSASEPDRRAQPCKACCAGRVRDAARTVDLGGALRPGGGAPDVRPPDG